MFFGHFQTTNLSLTNLQANPAASDKDNYKFVVGEFALIELLCISCHDLFPNMEINTLIISIITAIGRTT